jgi:hypothetical protein
LLYKHIIIIEKEREINELKRINLDLLERLQQITNHKIEIPHEFRLVKFEDPLSGPDGS